MSEYRLVVTSSNIQGTTGHHSLNVYIEETCTDGTVVKGTPETYGIDSRALQLKYGGRAESWREWIAKDMLAKYKRWTQVASEIMLWHGKKFDVTE